MLKRLKIKFVIVIMIIVTILFGAIFFSIMHFTEQNMERESLQMMRAAAFAPSDVISFNPPQNVPENIRVPFFKLEMDENGEIQTFGGEYYDLSDKDFIKNLFNLADENDDDTGIISDYNLRYMKNYINEKHSITFADISNEKMMLRGLIKNFLIIGFIAYIIFFIISLILAKWVTKPVEKAWNEQKQFIADASHELKTPLTVIMTNAEMLTDKDYSEADRDEFNKNILSMSKRMRGLIESLLELARMDNKITVSKPERINYSKLISDCVLPFEPLFFEKDMFFYSDINSDIYVEGDKSKLRQVIDILLDNALKYSDTDKEVRISLIHQGGNCIMSVSGFGNTLSKTECVDIFKRFYRIDKVRNDGQSYGLGLSIAYGIVKEHGGKIWVESANGKNTFFVCLPLH